MVETVHYPNISIRSYDYSIRRESLQVLTCEVIRGSHVKSAARMLNILPLSSILTATSGSYLRLNFVTFLLFLNFWISILRGLKLEFYLQAWVSDSNIYPWFIHNTRYNIKICEQKNLGFLFKT